MMENIIKQKMKKINKLTFLPGTDLKLSKLESDIFKSDGLVQQDQELFKNYKNKSWFLVGLDKHNEINYFARVTDKPQKDNYKKYFDVQDSLEIMSMGVIPKYRSKKALDRCLNMISSCGENYSSIIGTPKEKLFNYIIKSTDNWINEGESKIIQGHKHIPIQVFPFVIGAF